MEDGDYNPEDFEEAKKSEKARVGAAATKDIKREMQERVEKVRARKRKPSWLRGLIWEYIDPFCA